MYGEKLTQSDEWCRVSDVATMNRARRLDVVLPRVLMAALPPRLFIFPPVQHATSGRGAPVVEFFCGKDIRTI